MNFSLNALVKNLSEMYFKCLSQEFSGDLLKLVKQKGVYPYEYIDSFKRSFGKELPGRCELYCSLKYGCISFINYLHAINVGNVFKMNAVGGYHDLYLKTGILLLTDVFEKFINTCLDFYGLEPCHYFSNPRLCCDAILKMAEIELELISDIDMYLFIKKGMKGSIYYIAKRYNKANNKYIQSYDDKKPNKYIMYSDKNNLYGWAIYHIFPMMDLNG